MTLHWPQFVYLILVLLSLGMSLSKRREVEQVIGSLLGSAIMVWLLWCGGFFTCEGHNHPPGKESISRDFPTGG